MARYLLKLSGEALAGEKHQGLDEDTVLGIAAQVKQIVDAGNQVAIVTGGGNFWRGRSAGSTMDRVKADQIGMLATVMNCVFCADLFRVAGMKTRVYTPFEVGGITRLFNKDAVMKTMAKGEVVFFAGGTGHPYFSTDTGTILRAIEIEADSVLLAKSIDGVYNKDPKKHPDAVRYDSISIEEVIANDLQVIDMTASILCKENRVPLLVFDLNAPNSIINTVNGNFDGTRVTV